MPKLIKESLINIIWVFGYTAQKQEIKYQQNNRIGKLNKKKKKNLIFKHFNIIFDFLTPFL